MKLSELLQGPRTIGPAYCQPSDVSGSRSTCAKSRGSFEWRPAALKSLPILHRLPQMHFCPCFQKAPFLPRKVSANHLHRVDGEDGRRVLIVGMDGAEKWTRCSKTQSVRVWYAVLPMAAVDRASAVNGNPYVVVDRRRKDEGCITYRQLNQQDLGGPVRCWRRISAEKERLTRCR